MSDALELLTQKQQVHFTTDKDEEVISVLWLVLSVLQTEVLYVTVCLFVYLNLKIDLCVNVCLLTYPQDTWPECYVD